MDSFILMNRESCLLSQIAKGRSIACCHWFLSSTLLGKSIFCRVFPRPSAKLRIF
jgi:hypothetical protein